MTYNYKINNQQPTTTSHLRKGEIVKYKTKRNEKDCMAALFYWIFLSLHFTKKSGWMLLLGYTFTFSHTHINIHTNTLFVTLHPAKLR